MNDSKIKLLKKFIIAGVFFAIIGFIICFPVLGYAFFNFNSTTPLAFEFNLFDVFFIGMIFVFLGVLLIKLPILWFGIQLKKSDIVKFLMIPMKDNKLLPFPNRTLFGSQF